MLLHALLKKSQKRLKKIETQAYYYALGTSNHASGKDVFTIKPEHLSDYNSERLYFRHLKNIYSISWKQLRTEINQVCGDFAASVQSDSELEDCLSQIVMFYSTYIAYIERETKISLDPPYKYEYSAIKAPIDFSITEDKYIFLEEE